MKPCFSKRKLIAWLALGELDARRAQDLQAHIETCAGCRRYLEEISAIGAKLAAAETKPEIEPSAAFHQRLRGRLSAEQPGGLWNTPAAWLAGMRLHWRVALPVMGTAALVMLALALFPRHPGANPSLQASHPASVPLAPPRDLRPTVANYQQVAGRSLNELDDLLTMQARRKVSRTPIYTASMLALADAPD